MDSKNDPETIMMDADALDAPLLQVTQDEESALSPVQSPVATTPERNSEQQPIHANTTIAVMDQVTRGEKQPSQYRDSVFAVLFVGHLVAVGFFGFAWGIPAIREGLDVPSTSNNNHDSDHESLSGILGVCFLSAVAAVGIIFGALAVMIRHAEQLIQASLCISIGLTLLFAVAFAAEGVIVLAVLYFVMFLMGVWYAYWAWRRIPFARANLVTATTAINSNLGIVGVAFGLVVALVAWIFVWTLSFTGVYMRTRSCDSSGECDEGTAGHIAGLFMLLSFYWTSQVIKNVLVVTVSGVVGTWWFAPHEANSFWSPAISDSFGRATTYSFGSVCLGSLLVAIIQVLHQMVHEARRSNDRNSLILCILECIVAFLESIAEYFNKFAQIYVGLYGYDYLTAGKKVMELFKNRGWTTIINDNLVLRTLALINLAVGALTGCAGMVICLLIPSWLKPLFGDNDFIVAFCIAFIIGFFMSNVVLGIIASATDTVIVCFAESPNDFQANFPELSQQMLLAWRQIYPEECGF